VPIDSA